MKEDDWQDDPATQRQIDYARSLGLKVSAHDTKGIVNDIISEALEDGASVNSAYYARKREWKETLDATLSEPIQPLEKVPMFDGMDPITVIKHCLKCGTDSEIEYTPLAECPKCGAIYARVEEAIARKAANDAQKERIAAEKKVIEEANAQRRQEQANAAKLQGIICARCGHLGKPKKIAPGSFAIEMVLWIVGIVTVFIVIGFPILLCAIIYSLWRISSRKKACAKCGSFELMPTDTPNGKALLLQYGYVKPVLAVNSQTH